MCVCAVGTEFWPHFGLLEVDSGPRYVSRFYFLVFWPLFIVISGAENGAPQ